jgi:hypothetical protein
MVEHREEVMKVLEEGVEHLVSESQTLEQERSLPAGALGRCGERCGF